MWLLLPCAGSDIVMSNAQVYDVSNRLLLAGIQGLVEWVSVSAWLWHTVCFSCCGRGDKQLGALQVHTVQFTSSECAGKVVIAAVCVCCRCLGALETWVTSGTSCLVASRGLVMQQPSDLTGGVLQRAGVRLLGGAAGLPWMFMRVGDPPPEVRALVGL